jgi:CheY-like chemotaxis protein
MMPEMDGFEFLAALRAQGASIPVVVLTAKHLTPDERSYLDGAAEQILQKDGGGVEAVLAEVRRLIACA